MLPENCRMTKKRIRLIAAVDDITWWRFVSLRIQNRMLEGVGY